MPLTHVAASNPDLLQEIANTVGKSRKVVVITGAGISTNSGIPDFRSENGLYSLIQAQFERATVIEPEESINDDDSPEFNEPPSKRRRIFESDVAAKDGASNLTRDDGALGKSATQPHLDIDISSREDGGSGQPDDDEPQLPIVAFAPEPDDSRTIRPSLPRHITEISEKSTSSQETIFSNQLSAESSQTDDSVLSGSQHHPSLRTGALTPKRLVPKENFSSSPLSSPPPILFDPYESSTDSNEGGSQPSSECSDTSDTEDTQQSLEYLSSQTSNTSSLRNMKGRDLFDCNIWADPLKTSVFYRFATSLRQKVKEVQPTATHHFIAQLRDVGKLARVYTQNIDEIEKKIGLSTDLRNGAGSKRRKSAKQQLADLEKAEKEAAHDEAERQKSDEQPDSIGSQGPQPAPQTADDDAARLKSRAKPNGDKGVECVFLHGSLQSLRCFVCAKTCDWDEADREACTLSGEQPECPHCAGATAARQERGKRALGVGKLRPDIVLYGEEHPQSDLISPIVQHDLSGGPDLLLVLGTSLRVHGLKVMVKEFAKSVHNKGGKVVFVNFTKPSESVWGDIIDYWVEWDCDAWVDNLRDRKPHLWMSPEQIQEQERQKREALAEKRRESMLKRESTNEKKRDSLGEKKPLAITKSDREDKENGAYVVWEMRKTLAKIGGRPFENGYIPPPIIPKRAPSQVAVQPVIEHERKPRKSRKSAPAALTREGSGVKPPRPAVKAKYLNGTVDQPKPQTAVDRAVHIQTAESLPQPAQAGPATRLTELNDVSTPPAREVPMEKQQDSSESISATIKSNPRRRRPKRHFEEIVASKSATILPPPSPRVSNSARVPSSRKGWSGALPGPPPPYLEPLHSGSLVQQLPSNFAKLVSYDLKPLRHSDPLRILGYGKAPNTRANSRKAPAFKDATPSPSDQLQREYEAASVLGGRFGRF